MHVAVGLGLALCVALTVQPAHSRDGERDARNEEVDCDNLRFLVRLRIGYDLLIIDYKQTEVLIPYGVSLELRCVYVGLSAPRLAIMKQRELLSNTMKYDTYISFTTTQVGLQQRTEYTCTIQESVCEISKFISGVPTLMVNSWSDWFAVKTQAIFNIKYGDSLSVVCCGPSAFGLILTMDGKQLPTEHKDINTIHWFESRPHLKISTYVCTDVDTGYNRSVLIKVLPLIDGYGISPDMNNYDDNQTLYELTLDFKDSISEVFCFGPRPVQFMRPKNYKKEVFVETLNETTAKLSISRKEIGEWGFACVDSEFPDYRSTVRITVTPKMVVLSPHIYRYDSYYYAKSGDPLEITCSGPDVAQLTMQCSDDENRNRNETLARVNDTTIKMYINKLELREQFARYNCSMREVESDVYIAVLPHPEAVDLHCISYNFFYLNCTWSTSSVNNNFTLSYVDDGIPIHIYAKAFSPSTSNFYVWYWYDDPPYPRDVATLSFIMQSCNELGCFNQTFPVDHFSIIKPNPPDDISLNLKDSLDVMLQWDTSTIRLARKYYSSTNGDFNYRVEYWYPGIEHLEVNSSLVICPIYGCFIKLKLPCPEQTYEFRVYQKLKELDQEEFWSDPASLTVYIGAKNDKMGIETLACIEVPRKTKDVMIYFIQQLRQEVRLAKPQMKKEVSSLEKKWDDIQTYIQHTKDKL